MFESLGESPNGRPATGQQTLPAGCPLAPRVPWPADALAPVPRPSEHPARAPGVSLQLPRAPVARARVLAPDPAEALEQALALAAGHVPLERVAPRRALPRVANLSAFKY